MPEHDETVVADPAWVWPLFPLAGAGLGWLLTFVAGWVAMLPVAPLQVVFGFVAGLPEPWATIVAVAAGGAAGLAFSAYARRESLTVAVSAGRAVLTSRGNPVAVDRDRTGAAFVDGKDLVLLSRDGNELAREKSDLDRDELAQAFTGHGWPWRPDGDPYRDEFRRWVPDLPDLPAAAHALFQARATALEKEDSEDAAQLRAELARLGIVVRDEQTRQFWRRLPDSVHGS